MSDRSAKKYRAKRQTDDTNEPNAARLLHFCTELGQHVSSTSSCGAKPQGLKARLKTRNVRRHDQLAPFPGLLPLGSFPTG